MNNISYPDVEMWGWCVVNNELVVKWDSESNVKHIDSYRKLWTSGCRCKRLKEPCSSKLCGCRKLEKLCGPGCRCNKNCCNRSEDASIVGLMTRSQVDNEPCDIEEDEVLTDDEMDYECDLDMDELQDEQEDEEDV